MWSVVLVGRAGRSRYLVVLVVAGTFVVVGSTTVVVVCGSTLKSFGDMFDAGAKQRDDYKQGVESIFDQFLQGMNKRAR